MNCPTRRALLERHMSTVARRRADASPRLPAADVIAELEQDVYACGAFDPTPAARLRLILDLQAEVARLRRITPSTETEAA